jgi:C_GCAxxG_C_C family probable redox protein
MLSDGGAMAHDSDTGASRAEHLFIEGYSCSQAVLMAFAPRLGLDTDLAARAATGFGAGMARQGWTCGALTGALIVIGLFLGSREPGDSAEKNETYAQAALLFERFRAVHGATQCRELTGCEMSDSVQRQAAADAGVFKTLCPRLVRTAATFVDEIIDADEARARVRAEGRTQSG